VYVRGGEDKPHMNVLIAGDRIVTIEPIVATKVLVTPR
jgi:hypothetical protein